MALYGSLVVSPPMTSPYAPGFSSGLLAPAGNSNDTDGDESECELDKDDDVDRRPVCDDGDKGHSWEARDSDELGSAK